jgi:hypothetical protein
MQENTLRGMFYPGIMLTSIVQKLVTYARFTQPAVMRATSNESADALDPDRVSPDAK